MTRTEKKQLAQLARQVAAGTIPIDHLEAVALECDDGSLLHEQLMSHIDDLAEHPAEFRTGRFRGRKRLDEERRQLLARFSLFLYTDSEYKWPRYDGPAFNRYDPLFLLLTATLVSCGLITAFILPWVSAGTFMLAALTYFYSRQVLTNEIQKYFDHQNSIGNYSIWPFRDDDDYNLVLTNPPLLNGNTKIGG